jgi:prevent-host-death family protein
MATRSATEMSVRAVREGLADVLNAAGTRDEVTFVTSHGRRVAAVVPVAVGERAAMEARAEDDGHMAVLYATNVGIIEEHGGIPGRTMVEVWEDYASELLGEFGGSGKRTLAAARAVAASLPEEVGYPARWRYASMAVELCQGAAEIADGELPGSYRPGSRASKVRR